jgi:hypothetical protein
VAIHERFGDHASPGARDCRDAIDVLRRERQRLFAQDVLARIERAQRPLDVQRIRQRDVNRVDGRIADQGVVAGVCDRDLPLGGIRLSAPAIAAGDGSDRRSARGTHRRDQPPVDLRGPEQELAKHGVSSDWHAASPASCS